jgi:hypothetical protein
MSSDPPIDEIRRVRHEISAACDHDPKKLVAYYQELQGHFQGKVINIGAKQSIILKELPVSPNEDTAAPQA